jgi:hypothetical protein
MTMIPPTVHARVDGISGLAAKGHTGQQSRMGDQTRRLGHLSIDRSRSTAESISITNPYINKPEVSGNGRSPFVQAEVVVALVGCAASPYIQQSRRFVMPTVRPEGTVSDAKGQMSLQTSAEFVRTYNAQAHEIVDAITAAVTNAEAGLNWLRAESPDLEKVRQALDGIASDGKRAAEIVVRLRALMNKVAHGDGTPDP